MNKVFVFPGQGSQHLGMGKDLYDNFPVARHVFEEVDDALDQKLSDIIFGEDLELLTLTENTQPALMVVSMAIISVIRDLSGKSIEDFCTLVAGHSLGEYTALCAAGSISLRDTAKLLKVRGSAMQSACKPGQGGMIACIGISAIDLEPVIQEINKGEACQIANDNSLEQVVVSGTNAAMDMLEHKMKELGKKAVRLKVSAPFHSSLIAPAAEAMSKALSEVTISKPRVPVVQNVVVEAMTDPAAIVDNLVAQVTGRVRWRETMDYFAKVQVSCICEIGPGKVLTTLAKRSGHGFGTENVSDVGSARGCVMP